MSKTVKNSQRPSSMSRLDKDGKLVNICYWSRNVKDDQGLSGKFRVVNERFQWGSKIIKFYQFVSWGLIDGQGVMMVKSGQGDYS